MNKILKILIIAIIVMAFVLPAEAGKPINENGDPIGNGFPSGPHYNLIIHGKRANYNCPAPEFDPITGEQIYGNVINIPREQGNDPITILMESGAKGPKGAQGIIDLQVTDWCSESFPDYGSSKGDCAVLRLPANDQGYAVYARITGKPSDEPGEPRIEISPDLVYVEDEAGNDLILLGLVDRQGVATFGSDLEVIRRTSTGTSTKGKGVQKATNITALFEWTGEVCYIQEDSNLYCEDEYGNWICSELPICCVDNIKIDPVTGAETPGPDGIYESCDLLTNVGVLSDDGTTLKCPDSNLDGLLDEPIMAQCRAYENEWVFNIADFVGYLWELDSTGAYNIQVRFYPLPLNIKEQQK